MKPLGLPLYVFFQAEDGIRGLVRSRGLGDVYKRQVGQDAIVTATYRDIKSDILGKITRGEWKPGSLIPVSYTHLTLPTIYSV